jgi:putative FmdB family regulatory protein
MPFYEYRCEECGSVKEFRASMDKKEEMASTLVCDVCDSKTFTQVFSGIALTGSAPETTGMPRAGSCCRGGMCNI